MACEVWIDLTVLKKGIQQTISLNYKPRKSANLYEETSISEETMETIKIVYGRGIELCTGIVC